MKKLFILLVIVLVIISCGKQEKDTQKMSNSTIMDRKKPLSWGRPYHIYVFADDNVWKYARNKLTQTLERTIFTTSNEKMFMIERVDIEKLEEFYKFNNLIFLADASSDQPVADYVKEVLGKKLKPELDANGAAMFPAFNLWANDQLVLFLTGETEESLLKLNILQADRIYEIFKDRLYKRKEFQLYRSVPKPESNFSDQDWTLAIPRNFNLFKQDKENNFISYLSRSEDKPDCYLAVYSQNVPADSLNRSWLINKRNQIFGRYYEGDQIKNSEVISSKSSLAGYEGIKLSGRWQNDTLVMGGAFSTYAFFVKEKNMIYIIDNSVYFPAGDKLPSLIELEIISRTFELK